MIMNDSIWIFKGTKMVPGFPSGVFNDKNFAEKWITENNLSGTLTQYPVNISIYDWVIEKQFFKPSKEKHFEPSFIANYSSAYQEHYHYEDGKCLDES